MLKLICTAALCLTFCLPTSAQVSAKAGKTAPSVPVAPAAKPATSTVPATPPPLGEPGETKTFEVRYADPEQLRDMFAGRSFVMDANRELKLLSVHGTAAFLKEVEDTVKRFDVPPPPPANVQINVYLLTVPAQAPAGGTVPADLAALAKELSPGGAPAMILADSQMMRLRDEQPGEQASTPGAPDSAAVSRIRLRRVKVIPGAKGEMISLTGLQVWLAIPAAAAGAAVQTRTDADVSADIDVDQNVPVVVSKAGIDKPVVVIVRATIAK